MYFVYILKSEKDESYYIGQTSDLNDRLKRHNEGRFGYTKSKIPGKLIYLEEFDTRKEAIKSEKEIKSRKQKSYIEYLITYKDKK